MKVAIGYHVQDGPWGGGNRFAKALASAFQARGDAVVYDLKDRDIDVILLTDPRARSANVSFAAGKVLRYLTRRPQALVFHRINECDERKNTRDMNARLRRANYAADHTIFIASWLKDLDVWRRETPYSVVLKRWRYHDLSQIRRRGLGSSRPLAACHPPLGRQPHEGL